MIRWVLLTIALSAVIAVPAVVAYATLTLPESGDVQHSGESFGEWLEASGGTEPIAAACRAVNETEEAREACFTQSVASEQEDWIASGRREDDTWTASEIATNRNTYILVGALALAAEALALAVVISALRRRRFHMAPADPAGPPNP